MFTTFGSGSLDVQKQSARRLSAQLNERGFDVCRIKIETELDTPSVPETDQQAAAAHLRRHFEFHVKLLLAADSDVPALTALARSHASHLPRNARRIRDDRRLERFVTQRCFAVGRSTALRRLDALLSALSNAGYPVLDIEREYVGADSQPFTRRRLDRIARSRFMKQFLGRFFSNHSTFVPPPRPVSTPNPPAPVAPRQPPGQFPATFDPDRPPSVTAEVSQPRVFDPSLLNFRNAFRWGEPTFTDPTVSGEWALARHRVMTHLLTRVAESPAADSLMLRGSVLLKLWLGEAARDPGDLDWIVDPPSAKLSDSASGQLIETVIPTSPVTRSIGSVGCSWPSHRPSR